MRRDLCPSTLAWYILQSSDLQFRGDTWGLASDNFVPADFDGDGKTDLAVFRSGVWYIKQSSDNQPRYETFGAATDKLVPADYDGDAKPMSQFSETAVDRLFLLSFITIR